MASDRSEPTSGEPVDPAAEARDNFEDAFDRLIERSAQSAELRRETDDFDTLSADHAELAAMRSETWQAKKDVVSRYEPPTPDYVEQPIGHQDTSGFSRIAALAGALLLFAAIPLVWFAWSRNSVELDVDIVAAEVVISPTTEGTTCRLVVDLAITNGTDNTYEVDRVNTIVDRARRVMRPVTGPNTPAAIKPGAAPVMSSYFVSVSAIDDQTCPAADDLGRQSITVDFERLGRRISVSADR